MKLLSILWGVVAFLFSFLMFIAWLSTLLKLLLGQYKTHNTSYNAGYITGYIAGELIWLYLTYLLFRYSIKKIRGN